MRKLFASLATTLVTITGVSASSEDAWATFAAEVEQGCLAATSSFFTEATATVDPFGSENYGLAIVSGLTPAGTTASTICVFDKQTKAVEIGGELDVDVTALEAVD